MSEVPTIRDELNRKSFEALEWLAVDFDHGKLTRAQYAAGLEALFMTVAGLVDEEIFKLITEASKIAGTPPHTERRILVKNNTVVLLTWHGGCQEFHIEVVENGVTKTSMSQHRDTPVLAREAMKNYVKVVLESGYREL